MSLLATSFPSYLWSRGRTTQQRSMIIYIYIVSSYISEALSFEIPNPNRWYPTIFANLCLPFFYFVELSFVWIAWLCVCLFDSIVVGSWQLSCDTGCGLSYVWSVRAGVWVICTTMFRWSWQCINWIPWNHNSQLNMSVWWKHAFIRSEVHQLHVANYEFIRKLIDLQSQSTFVGLRHAAVFCKFKLKQCLRSQSIMPCESYN